MNSLCFVATLGIPNVLSFKLPSVSRQGAVLVSQILEQLNHLRE